VSILVTEQTDIDETQGKQRSKLPLILGIALGIASAGGGFATMYLGLLGGKDATDTAETEGPEEPQLPMADMGGEVAFIPVDPLIISLDDASGMHLRFRAQLEVSQAAQDDVARLMPRVVDVLNGYLRALELRDLQDRSALTRLRAQMLRRVQVVAGGAQVKDLLIMEFVLN
jgi:flagellar FliL protein